MEIDLTPAIEATLFELITALRERLEQNGSVITGHLKRTIQGEVVGNVLRITMPEYGEYVEFGTKAHEITPKNKKALMWDGAEHPVKKVMHPGSKAKPFIRPVMHQEFPKILVANLQEVINAKFR